MLAITEFTIVDAAGLPLCHSKSQTFASLNSRRRREVREQFDAMCRAAGALNDKGEYLDVVTGAWLPKCEADTDPNNMAVIERGHVISDSHGGPYCPCNLVPQNRGANKGNGKHDLKPSLFRTPDPRYSWRYVWPAFAPGFKLPRVALTEASHGMTWPCCDVSLVSACQC